MKLLFNLYSAAKLDIENQDGFSELDFIFTFYENCELTYSVWTMVPIDWLIDIVKVAPVYPVCLFCYYCPGVHVTHSEQFG